MSNTEENKQVLRRFVEELINANNLSLAAEIVAPDYAFITPARPEPVRGPDGLSQLLTRLRGAFPDLHCTIDDLVAEGDRVALRYTFEGTHRGEFHGVPPSGKRVKWSGITLCRFEGGKAVEDRPFEDRLGLLRQLGALPTPADTGLRNG